MNRIALRQIVARAFAVSILAFGFSTQAFGASLEKAMTLMEKGDFKGARRQYEALIRNGTRSVREKAYLGLARSYFLEKDFRGVLRSFGNTRDLVPENKNGAWMRLMLYRSARAVGDWPAASNHYQALLRLQPDFSMAEISDHLQLLRKLDLIQNPGRLPVDTEGSAGWKTRREWFSLAESLMALEISGSAKRMWMALVTGRLDEVGRTALFRLGQAYDLEGNWMEASRNLKLYVLLFVEDQRSADALYRLGKWAALLGADETPGAFSLAAEFYPNTLYGVRALVDDAWSNPTPDRVRIAARAVRESPGLPDPVLDLGLAIAIEYPQYLSSESDREWAARKYLATFPAGFHAEKARAIIAPKPENAR